MTPELNFVQKELKKLNVRFYLLLVLQIVIFIVFLSLPIKRFFYLPDPLDYFFVIFFGMMTIYGAFLSNRTYRYKIVHIELLDEIEVKFIKYRKCNTRRLISFTIYNFINGCVYYFLVEYVFMIVFFVTFLFYLGHKPSLKKFIEDFELILEERMLLKPVENVNTRI